MHNFYDPVSGNAQRLSYATGVSALIELPFNLDSTVTAKEEGTEG